MSDPELQRMATKIWEHRWAVMAPEVKREIGRIAAVPLIYGRAVSEEEYARIERLLAEDLRRYLDSKDHS